MVVNERLHRDPVWLVGRCEGGLPPMIFRIFDYDFRHQIVGVFSRVVRGHNTYGMVWPLQHTLESHKRLHRRTSLKLNRGRWSPVALTSTVSTRPLPMLTRNAIHQALMLLLTTNSKIGLVFTTTSRGLGSGEKVPTPPWDDSLAPRAQHHGQSRR